MRINIKKEKGRIIKYIDLSSGIINNIVDIESLWEHYELCEDCFQGVAKYLRKNKKLPADKLAEIENKGE